MELPGFVGGDGLAILSIQEYVESVLHCGAMWILKRLSSEMSARTWGNWRVGVRNSILERPRSW